MCAVLLEWPTISVSSMYPLHFNSPFIVPATESLKYEPSSYVFVHMFRVDEVGHILVRHDIPDAVTSDNNVPNIKLHVSVPEMYKWSISDLY